MQEVEDEDSDQAENYHKYMRTEEDAHSSLDEEDSMVATKKLAQSPL